MECTLHHLLSMLTLHCCICTLLHTPIHATLSHAAFHRTPPYLATACAPFKPRVPTLALHDMTHP
jgi:hypothetical protein